MGSGSLGQDDSHGESSDRTYVASLATPVFAAADREHSTPRKRRGAYGGLAIMTDSFPAAQEGRRRWFCNSIVKQNRRGWFRRLESSNDAVHADMKKPRHNDGAICHEHGVGYEFYLVRL